MEDVLLAFSILRRVYLLKYTGADMITPLCMELLVGSGTLSVLLSWVCHRKGIQDRLQERFRKSYLVAELFILPVA